MEALLLLGFGIAVCVVVIFMIKVINRMTEERLPEEISQELERELTPLYPGCSIRIVERGGILDDCPSLAILAVRSKRIGFLPWFPEELRVAGVNQIGPTMYDFYAKDPKAKEPILSVLKRQSDGPYTLSFHGPERIVTLS